MIYIYMHWRVMHRYHRNAIHGFHTLWTNPVWVPSQYPKRRLFLRSRKVSKSRDLYLELSDRSEIWQALRQHCCRCACQISKRYDNLKYQSRGFEISRDLTKRRLFGYWDGALVVAWSIAIQHNIGLVTLLDRGWTYITVWIHIYTPKYDRGC